MEAGSLKQCFEKKRYATQVYAEGLLEKLSAKYETQMRCYYCGICNGYHLTSTKRRK